MIEINLLPEELRVKVKTKSVEPVSVKPIKGFSMDKVFIYAIPAILSIFVLLNFFYFALFILKNHKLVELNLKWVQMEPQKKAFDEFNRDFSAALSSAGISQALTNQRILWAQKLNKLSLDLPPGIWFNEISAGAKELVIKGSVISLEKEEVSLIQKFLDNLKQDADFGKDFSGFELNNVQKREIESYSVADFSLTGVLKK